MNSERKSAAADMQPPGESVLRLSLTDRCNLKCSYCHVGNGHAAGEAHGKPNVLLPSIDAIMAQCGCVIEAFNVVKVRLTGGEPLVRRDVDEAVRRLKDFAPVRHVGITTNGQMLAAWAGRLKAAGVDSVNVSLDSLEPDRYAKITAGGDVGKVIAGIRSAKQAGIGMVKVNVVVLGGVNDDELEDMIFFSMDEGIEVRFLELMSFEGSSAMWERRFVSREDILKRISQKFSVELLEDRKEQTAVMYGVKHGGRRAVAGIIGSSDGHMCHACNRIRISADGKLRRCLKDPLEIDLGRMIRAGCPGELIRESLRAYLDLKVRPAPLAGNGSMQRIGG
ncbi:MAG: radical SAM protein [Pseudomonadota bacterium]